MVKLLLWRHAKAIRQENITDEARGLSAVGRDDRMKIAAIIAGQFPPDFIICSIAQRTQETLEALTHSAPVQISEALYHGHIDDILNLARGIDDSLPVLLLVGHNPGFEDMVVKILNNGRAHQVKQLRRFHPGDLAEIDWDSPSWHDIKLSEARLSSLHSTRA